MPILRFAISTGWIKRRPRKIFLVPLIGEILECILSRGISYQNIAISFAGLRGETVSRQAVFKRVNASFVSCLQKCIEYQLEQKSGKDPLIAKLFKPFKRVLVQDSSCFQAPDKLVHYYKGNFSRGKTKAVGKVDVVWNIKNGKILEWVLKPFIQNDQGASRTILPMVQKGDLVIRDLGYLVIGVLQKLRSTGADFLSRYKHGANLYDCKTGEKLKLLKTLRKTKNLDRTLLIGEEKLQIRLVAIRLSDKEATNRRRKAKKNRDKRLSHSKEYMELLGWKIFITSVDRMVWTPEEIARAYGMRWTNEMLFKSWKSCLNANPPIHHAYSRPFFFETYIHLIMIFVIIVQLPVYMNLLLRKSKKNQLTQISLIKLSFFLAITFKSRSIYNKAPEYSIDLIEYYSKYEKRSRKNLAQRLWNPLN